MNLLRNVFLAFSILLMEFCVYGQEMSGTMLGNYAGLNGIERNPSALHNSKTYLDVQLVGMDFILQNNALYLPASDYRFSNFFKAGYQWPQYILYGVNVGNADIYKDTKYNKNLFVNTRLNGPGAMLIWNHHAFALSTSVRSVMSLHKIPYDLANFAYIGLGYAPQHNIRYTDNKPFTISEMAWGEIGLSYAYTFYARDFDQWSAGISVKRLLGISGMYVYSRQLDYMVLNDSTFNIYNADVDGGFALPINYYNNMPNTQPLFKGGGFGFDVGVTYQRLSKYHQYDYSSSVCGKPYEDYLFRIGVALIDIGGIRFTNNAVKMRIDNRSSYWEHVNSINFRNVNLMLDTISYKFYGDTTSAYVDDKFMLWLPSALSAQFDYHFRKNWYFNASLIYGFPLASGSVARPSELTITPRYETRVFEASMPISLYDWYLPRIGLALRIYGFTIGTDKLGGFFSFNDFTGLDFYFSVKLFFNKGNCANKGPEECGPMEPRPIRH